MHMSARHDNSEATIQAGEALKGNGRGKLGLIAGNGRLPISLAQAARAEGYEVVAVAIESEASPDLGDHVDRIFWVDVGHISRAIESFRSSGVEELVMAGRLQKERIFDLSQVESSLALAVGGLQARGDDAVLKAIVGVLEKSGLRVRESMSLLRSCVPDPGILSTRRPTDREQTDIDFGMTMARRLADLGIGQTVAVKFGVVVAVEAIEGTDAAINRAGACAGKGVVVVKASGPNQDIRFDMPVIGPKTIETLIAAGVAVLAVEAGRTVILDRADVLTLANESGLAVVAV